MSEHLWVQENLAAYLAAGLAAAERDRLEAHVAACPECAGALASAEALDRKLGQLFAAVRPGPDLEDAAILRLRQQAAPRRQLRFRGAARWVSAAAAVALLAMVGAGISEVLEYGSLDGLFGAGLQMDTRGQLIPKQMGLRYKALSARVPDVALAGEQPPKDADTLAQELREKHTEKGSRGWDFRSYQAGPMARKDSKTEDERTASPAPMVKRGKVGGQVRDGTEGYFATIDNSRGENKHQYFQPADGLATVKLNDASRALDDAPKGEKPKEASPPEKSADAPGEKKPEKEGGEKPAPNPEEPAKPAPEALPSGRKIIRSGDIDFEVDSFDAAVAAIQKLVAATKGGFLATINSDKLANGKVKGSVVVRVPPEQLDDLVLGLRKDLTKTGDLKGQRIGSQDITKQYTDLESRLKAARTMEERLIKIIKEGKGEIKDLLQAEKELGVWRTRIEELEGELRYYANQVSLSTLTIHLTEKEIRTAAAVVESERVQAGIEVDDVDKAYRAALQAITEAKGRVTRSELKQHGAGQYNALLHFEVAPEAAGQVRDRLRQLGTLVRLEIDRVQHAEGGGKLPTDGKLERGNTQFCVSMYNLANVAPRETVVLRVAAADVPQAYQALRAVVAKAQGRVINAQLNEQDKQNISAQLDFDVRRADEAQAQAALAEAGETLSRQVSRVPEGDNVTDAKVQYRVELVSAENVSPRETVLLAVEVPRVETALSMLRGEVKEVQGRVLDSKISLERSGRVTARVIYIVPLAAAPGVIEKIRDLGHVRVDERMLNQQAPTGKLAVARLDVTLSNELLVPQDQALWSQLRQGLSISLRGLAISAGWLLIGVLFVLPWVLVVLALLWLVRRLWRSTPAPNSPPATGA